MQVQTPLRCPICDRELEDTLVRDIGGVTSDLVWQIHAGRCPEHGWFQTEVISRPPREIFPVNKPFGAARRVVIDGREYLLLPHCLEQLAAGAARARVDPFDARFWQVAPYGDREGFLRRRLTGTPGSLTGLDARKVSRLAMDRRDRHRDATIANATTTAPAPRRSPSEPTSERPNTLTPISLLLVLIVAYVLMQIQFVVVLVLLSLVFATVIQQPVDALERRHVPRPLAILLVYVTLIGALVVLFAVVSPVIQDQATTFRAQAPESLGELRDAWQASGNALLAGPAQQLLGRAIGFIQEPGSGISLPQGAAIGLLTGLGRRD